MKLCTFETAGAGLVPGIVVGRRVVAVATAAHRARLDPEMSTIGALALDDDARRQLARAALDLAASEGHDVSDVALGPPVPDPDKIICLGLNYRDHAEEAGLPLPAAQILFAKNRGSLVGHGAPVIPPLGEHDIDYEAELAVVIGAAGRDILEEDAGQHIGAYTCFNDVSARDLQNLTPQWMAGKSIDTFGPCGPWMTTADEVPDPQALGIRARVNGDVVQDGNTKDMIFGIAAQIAFISSLMELLPGDIIATGTPAGVGFTRTPQILLRHGDVVEVEIDGLGTLCNPIVERGRQVGADFTTHGAGSRPVAVTEESLCHD